MLVVDQLAEVLPEGLLLHLLYHHHLHCHLLYQGLGLALRFLYS
jgi:hypothetical protein